VKIINGIAQNILFHSRLNRFKYISQLEYEVIKNFEFKKLSELEISFGVKNVEIIVNDLINHDYGFYLSENEYLMFPPLNEEYISPAQIENTIIDFGEYCSLDVFRILLNQFEKFQTRSLLLRFFNIPSENTIIQYIELLENSSFVDVELVVPYNSIDFKNIEEPRISRIVFFNCPDNKLIHEIEYKSFSAVFLRETLSPDKCGVIDESMFVIDYDHYCIAKKYNSCLFKKISIDSKGFIKNCPSMKINYGHVSEINIEQVVNLPEFQEWWVIKKDDINVCKECELRYFCHDCRAFTVGDENFGKPINCKYNPKTNIWED
jgi:SPASM domain peptide maturase of grasp-with-spasm system